MTQSTRPPKPRPDTPASAAAFALIFLMLAVFLLLFALRPSDDGFGLAPYVPPARPSVVVPQVTPTP